MIRSFVCVAVLAALALLPASASAALEPKDLVRSFYGEASVSLLGARSGTYFSQDLDAALKARGAAALGGFDFRYTPGELRVTDLDVLQEIDNDRARVVAVFKNHGRANSVNWAMCRREDGSWRIADASSNSTDVTWDLRRLLNLPTEVQC
jgi:hypothetical protein